MSTNVLLPSINKFLLSCGDQQHNPEFKVSLGVSDLRSPLRPEWLQVDSKKELEKLLKVTCEVFIMSVTKATVEPMLSFITKVTAVRARSKYTSHIASTAAQPQRPKPLREQVIQPEQGSTIGFPSPQDLLQH